jgi:hypothetical protein
MTVVPRTRNAASRYAAAQRRSVACNASGDGRRRGLAEPWGSLMLRPGAALFQARAEEARQLGLPVRGWPPTVAGHARWDHDYKRAAASASIELSLDAAVAEINAWIARVANA